MEMGVHKTTKYKQAEDWLKEKLKKSLSAQCCLLYYPLQQEMLIYKDCIAELLVPYCGHTTPTLNSCLPLPNIL